MKLRGTLSSIVMPETPKTKIKIRKRRCMVHGSRCFSDLLCLAVEDSPKGFPIVARYLDSDDCFMIYRRFGFLHARLLLNKQDELRELDEELRGMDQRDRIGDAKARKCLMSRTKDDNRPLPEGWERSRKELLQEIEKKVMEYGRGEHSGRMLGLILTLSKMPCSFKRSRWCP